LLAAKVERHHPGLVRQVQESSDSRIIPRDLGDLRRRLIHEADISAQFLGGKFGANLLHERRDIVKASDDILRLCWQTSAEEFFLFAFLVNRFLEKRV